MALTYSDQLLRETAKAAFWQSYETQPDIMEGLVATVSSNADQETYPFLAYAPGVREMSGTRMARSVPALSYTITNKKWENTVNVAYELRKYGKIGAVASLLSNLGAKARAYPSKLINTLIENNGTCYDALSFFNDSHLDPGAAYTTTQDNNFTSAAATGTQPTDLEFADSMRTIISAFQSFKDGDGDPAWSGSNNRIIALVPPVFYAVAKRCSIGESLTGPVGNDLKGTFEVRVNPYSTSTSTYYAFNASGIRKPFVLQVAEPVTLEDSMGGDTEFLTKDVQFGSFAYYNAGYGDWRYAAKHVFS